MPSDFDFLQPEGGTSRQVIGLNNNFSETGILPISNCGKFVIRTPLQTISSSGVVGFTFQLQYSTGTGTVGSMSVKFGQPRLVKKSALTLAGL